MQYTSMEEIVNQLKKELKDESIDEEEINTFAERIYNISSSKRNVEDHFKNIGSYFYYHLKIENSIERLIKTLVPEIDLDFFRIQGFDKKIRLLKLLIPNSSKLNMFPLIKRINVIRNELAHMDVNEDYDFWKQVKDLIPLFNNCIFVKKKGVNSYIISEKNSPSFILSEIIRKTAEFIGVLTEVEEFGSKNDMKLQLSKIARSVSHKILSRRLSILIYMFQTGMKSEDAAKEFRMKKEFNDDLNKLKKVKFEISIPIKLKSKI